MNPVELGWLVYPSGRTARDAAPTMVAAGVAGLVGFTVLEVAWRLWLLRDSYVGYAVLAVWCVVTLVVPVTGAVGAAARLRARQQEDRIAVLRLMGLSVGKTRLLVTIDALGSAVAGLLVGWGCSNVVATLTWLMPLGGVTGGDRPPWELAVGVGLGLVGLIVGSALARMRQAIAAPMGTTSRVQARQVGWVRLVISVVGIVACLVLLQVVTASWGVVGIIVVLVIAMIVLMGVWGLLGPYLVVLGAKRLLRADYTPVELVVGRTLLDDPGAAWRQVSVLALMSFLIVPSVSVLGFLDAVGRGPTQLSAVQVGFFGDIGRVVVLTTVCSFVLVACSSVAYQIAAIIERADVYVALTRLGASVRELQTAHRRQVMTPVGVAVAGPVVLAVVATFPLTAIAVVTSPWSALVIVGCLGLGVTLLRVGCWTAQRYLARTVRRVPA